MSRDIYNNCAEVQSIAPAAHTEDVTGAAADLQGFGGALVLISAGAWTDGTHTFEVQDSDDNSTFTAVDAKHLQGTEPVIDGATDDDQVYAIGYTGHNRYLRVVATVEGATDGAIYGAVILRTHPNRASTR